MPANWKGSLSLFSWDSLDLCVCWVETRAWVWFCGGGRETLGVDVAFGSDEVSRGSGSDVDSEDIRGVMDQVVGEEEGEGVRDVPFSGSARA